MKKLEDKLLKAKISLMSRSVFISTIALSLKHVISDKCETAATDYKQVLYNPDFCDLLSVEEMTGLVAHECWHVVFQHNTRRGTKNHARWNAACDYVINNMLIEQGYDLPKEGIVNMNYRGMSAEQIYDLLDEDSEEYPMMDLLEPEESTEVAQADVKSLVVKAYTQSKLAGKASSEIPADMQRIIEDLLNPKLPWQVLLQQFINSRVKTKYSWFRRNRRYSGVFMPSLYNYGLDKITFAIDTSGSVSEEELREMLSEIKGIRDTLNPKEMKIIDCDSEIHHIHEVQQHTNILDLEFSGGGGTSFLPVLEYMKEHNAPLIYFTDLYAETDLPPVTFPVLWICNSSHPPNNIGQTIYLN